MLAICSSGAQSVDFVARHGIREQARSYRTVFQRHVLILSKNMGLSQPFRRFLRELLTLLVIVPGRATFLNLSRYSDYAEKTFRRWFRRKVDWAQLNVTAIRAVVPGDHESVLAFDPSAIAPYQLIGV